MMTAAGENRRLEDLDGIAAICSATLVRDRLRAAFTAEKIVELRTVYDHCVLRTCSGHSYVARLGRDGQIVLEEAS